MKRKQGVQGWLGWLMIIWLGAVGRGMAAPGGEGAGRILVVTSQLGLAESWASTYAASHRRAAEAPWELVYRQPGDLCRSAPAAAVSLVLLGRDELQGLPESTRANLQALLPRQVREAVSEPVDAPPITGREVNDDGIRYGVLSPTAAAGVLFALPENVTELYPKLSGAWIGTSERPGGQAVLEPLGPVKRIAIRAQNENDPQARELVRCLQGALQATDWEPVSDETLLLATHQQDLATALNTGQQVTFKGCDLLAIVDLTSANVTAARVATLVPTCPLPTEPGDKPQRAGFVSDRFYQLALQNWTNRMTVFRGLDREWRLSVVVEQHLTATGQMRLLQTDGTVRLSVPLRVNRYRLTDVTPEQAVYRCQGGNEPPRVDLKLGSSPMQPDSAAQQRLYDAVSQQMVAFLQGAVRRGATAAPAEQAAGEPVAAVQAVTVTGVGPDAPSARQDALRQAIEQVVGVYLSSETRVERFELLRDSIYTRSEGFAWLREVLEERRNTDGIVLRCRVEVAPLPLKRKLRELDLLRRWRVMVLTPTDDVASGAGWGAAQSILVRELADWGLQLVDPERDRQLALQAAVREAVADRPEALLKLIDPLRCDLAVVVSGRTAPAGAMTGLARTLAQAQVTIRIIDARTAETIDVADGSGTGGGETAMAAQQVAIRQATEALRQDLVDRLLRYATPATAGPRLKLVVHGLADYGAFGDLLEALAQFDQVSSVREEGFEDGCGTAEIVCGPNVNLARILSRAPELAPFKLRVTAANTALVEATLAAR